MAPLNSVMLDAMAPIDAQGCDLHFAELCYAIGSAYPDRTAIIANPTQLTWRATLEHSSAVAHVLASWGLGPDGAEPSDGPWQSPHPRVGLYLLNDPAYLIAQLGIYAARCVPVNVNYRYRSEEVAYLLADSEAKAVFVHSRFAPTLWEAIGPDVRVIQVHDDSNEALLPGAMWWHDLLGSVANAHEPPLRDSWAGTDHYLCYTGGTTGNPKGVLWTQHDFLLAALGIRRSDRSRYQSVNEIVQAAESSRLNALPTAPLMHGAAGWNAMSTWISGGTVVLDDHPEHFTPSSIWATAERDKVSSMLIVGDSFARPLLAELDQRHYDLSTLRHILSGGAVLSPQHKNAFLERIPGVQIVDVLGSTESGRQGVAVSAQVASGTFEPARTSVLLNEAASELLTPASHEIGWLAQTHHVPLGYLGDETKTAATFPTLDGVRYAIAGDRARYRDDGTIELLGRDSACINTGGEKVFAEEVETTIKTLDGVIDAVVCGVDSPAWGQQIVAVVSIAHRSELDSGDIIAHCKASLASFKAPKRVKFVTHVQRSPSGKADYRWAQGIASEKP